MKLYSVNCSFRITSVIIFIKFQVFLTKRNINRYISWISRNIPKSYTPVVLSSEYSLPFFSKLSLTILSSRLPSSFKLTLHQVPSISLTSLIREGIKRLISAEKYFSLEFSIRKTSSLLIFIDLILSFHPFSRHYLIQFLSTLL